MPTHKVCIAQGGDLYDFSAVYYEFFLLRTFDLGLTIVKPKSKSQCPITTGPKVGP